MVISEIAFDDIAFVSLQALLYFIHVMDHITVKEYVMVYFHTLTAEHNHLDSDFLKSLYDIVESKWVDFLHSLLDRVPFEGETVSKHVNAHLI